LQPHIASRDKGNLWMLCSVRERNRQRVGRNCPRYVSMSVDWPPLDGYNTM